MANNKNNNTWNSLLGICNELDNMTNLLNGYIPNFKKTSEDESLPENDRTTLSKLVSQFQEIIDINNSTNDKIRTVINSKSNTKIKYEDFDYYLELVDKLDVRMKISGAILETVLQRMHKVVEK